MPLELYRPHLNWLHPIFSILTHKHTRTDRATYQRCTSCSNISVRTLFNRSIRNSHNYILRTGISAKNGDLGLFSPGLLVSITNHCKKSTETSSQVIPDPKLVLRVHIEVWQDSCARRKERLRRLYQGGLFPPRSYSCNASHGHGESRKRDIMRLPLCLKARLQILIAHRKCR